MSDRESISHLIVVSSPSQLMSTFNCHLDESLRFCFIVIFSAHWVINCQVVRKWLRASSAADSTCRSCHWECCGTVAAIKHPRCAGMRHHKLEGTFAESESVRRPSLSASDVIRGTGGRPTVTIGSFSAQCLCASDRLPSVHSVQHSYWRPGTSSLGFALNVLCCQKSLTVSYMPRETELQRVHKWLTRVWAQTGKGKKSVRKWGSYQKDQQQCTYLQV